MFWEAWLCSCQRTDACPDIDNNVDSGRSYGACTVAASVISHERGNKVLYLVVLWRFSLFVKSLLGDNITPSHALGLSHASSCCSHCFALCSLSCPLSYFSFPPYHSLPLTWIFFIARTAAMKPADCYSLTPPSPCITWHWLNTWSDTRETSWMAISKLKISCRILSKILRCVHCLCGRARSMGLDAFLW